jgi:hypothetical protein
MAMKDVTYTWGGSYVFRLNGSGLHEDTIRIRSNYGRQEQILKLILPTLCITYADMKFQNSIGGEQENYPASQVYGHSYFDPPIEITGEQDIEKFTYIRGADCVHIGPIDTTIEFPSWKELVIPRLRIDQEKPIEANLHVPETNILVDEPLKICVLQYADGRHIGGVRLEKRHPKWQPSEEKEIYDLWLRVINGLTLEPFPEVMVDILHWDPKKPTPYGTGGFRLDDRKYTDGNGCIQIMGRPSGELEAFVVRLPGWRAVVRCLRPLAGQKVRLHIRVWPLVNDALSFIWQGGVTLDSMAQLTGHSIEDILRLNKFNDASELKPGMRIILPCYTATYRMEQWDDFDWVGKTFGYQNAEGLAKVNGLRDVASLNSGLDIKLPDWRFFYAGEKDTLEGIDTMFGLPKGTTITLGRVYHPDPRLPYAGETIAVPTVRFAELVKKRRKNI